jgi:hypothetical protein
MGSFAEQISWIDCQERLPVPDTPVVIAFTGDFYGVYGVAKLRMLRIDENAIPMHWLDTPKFAFDRPYIYTLASVSHWMPLLKRP